MKDKPLGTEEELVSSSGSSSYKQDKQPELDKRGRGMSGDMPWLEGSDKRQELGRQEQSTLVVGTLLLGNHEHGKNNGRFH